MHKTVEITLEKDILGANREIAEQNRSLLKKHDVKAYDFMGSIGSGKTTLIESLIDILKSKGIRAGVIAGDVAGDDDCRRFQKHDAQAINVNTGKECHLDAHMIGHALESADLENLDILFIENVGNLVCPLDFPLGTDKRVVVISVTEGDDMIRKHPLIFAHSDLTVLNKIDLAEAIEVDPKILTADFERLNPHGKILLTDAKHGTGVERVLSLLFEGDR
ncbi:MAG: hydrogenase nickel incorporation protein HypB [Halobacteriota archaeon]|nr:hydrogenase nickel incorporation protein HypB [Halobacteriota archaeon]